MTIYAPHGRPGQFGVSVQSLVEEGKDQGLEPVPCQMVRQLHQNFFVLEMRRKLRIALQTSAQVRRHSKIMYFQFKLC